MVAEILAPLLAIEPDALSAAMRLARAGQGYEAFSIPKVDPSKTRTIHAPVPLLKEVQRAILSVLEPLPLPTCVHGFRRGRSIVTAARAHLRARALLNVDLIDFFHSVEAFKVRRALLSSLIPRWVRETGELERRDIPAVLEALVTLTTFDQGHEGAIQRVLPQGAPTSPVLANLAARPLDRAILALIRDLPGELVYTRYADDLTISSPYEIDRSVLGEVLKAITRSGFRPHPAKIVLASTLKGSPHFRQRLTVTGLVVDPVAKTLRIPRDRLERFRAKMHQASHQPVLEEAVLEQIEGMVSFVLMVYGQLPPALEKAYARFTEAHGLKAIEPGRSRKIARRKAAQAESY